MKYWLKYTQQDWISWILNQVRRVQTDFTLYLAGIVLKTGSKVTRFKVGDEVYARAADFHIGTFAEYIAVNENDLALKQKNISKEEAASIPLVGLTVWQAFEKAKLRKGQKIFIQAGSGGVGTIPYN